MSRPLPLTERQVTALCRGAAKAGYVPVVKIGDVVVQLIPAEQALEPEKVDDKGKGYF